jgi:hypothetical protein
MEQHVSKRPAMLRALIVAILALVVGALALAPQAWGQAAPDRRNVSAAEEPAGTPGAGLPVWYQDANGTRVFQCLGDQVLCAIEDPAAIDEIIYWAGETSMPVGNAGEARLVMAVEGAFDAEAGGAPITGSEIRVDAEGLRPNTSYRVTHPYGSFQVRTDGQGAFRRLNGAGCDIEVGDDCNFRAALQHPIFRNFLRVDGARPQNYMGNPELPRPVVGSPTGNNFFRIDGPGAGGGRDSRAQVNRFSIVGQLVRDGDLGNPPPPEPPDA